MEHIDFIEEIQEIHDESMMIEEMRYRLQQLGLRHELEIPDDTIFE
jgi:hypothetical protein